MTLQLSRLSADGDWGALAQFDRELAAQLQLLSKRQLSREERTALDRLRSAHDAARERCEREFARVDTQLSQMRAHKEGWMAYAMSNELEEERA
jgi:hypothetical protein